MAKKKEKIESANVIGAELFDSYDIERKAQNGGHELIEYMRTYCLPLDMVNAGKGLPIGRSVCVYSDSGLGKSTLFHSACLGLITYSGKKVIYCGVEPAVELSQDMKLIGASKVVPEGFFRLLDIGTYDELMKVTVKFLKSDYDVMIIDSITALCPSLENMMDDDFSIEKATVGVDARIITAYLKFINVYLRRVNKTILYVAQSRANFTLDMAEAARVKAEGSSKIAGGKAVRFYANTVINITGAESIKTEMHSPL